MSHLLTCNTIVRTKIRDKERERIFESGVLDSEATVLAPVRVTSRWRRTALLLLDNVEN